MVKERKKKAKKLRKGGQNRRLKRGRKEGMKTDNMINFHDRMSVTSRNSQVMVG